MATTDDAESKNSPVRASRRILGRPIPAEGDSGLFTQSWYALCQSSQVAAGQVLGVPFLDGRVVVFRGENGTVQVMSAYCPHLGADLAVGQVIGNTLRCAFHHWHYDQSGTCIKTGTAEPPPQGACLFKFPTVERYGMIWAFNGETPLFDLYSFPYPEEDLVCRVEPEEELWNVDPWVACANTPDFHHMQTVHGMTLADEDPSANVKWTPHSMFYDLKGKLHGMDFEVQLGIIGTTIFYQTGMFNGRWTGRLSAFTMPEPGKTRFFHNAIVRRSDGTDEENAALLEFLIQIEREFIRDDHALMKTAHYRPGLMTRSDRLLLRFFDYVRSFPRAHPSAEFIR